MGLQSFSSALLAGVATAIAAAFIGADFAAAAIDTSVIVGIPIGLLAGVVIAGIVLATSGDAPARAALIATGMLGFAAGLLLTYVGLTRLIAFDELTSVGIGVVVGVLLAALFVYNTRD